VAYEGGLAPGAPARDKMVEAPPPVGVVGANATPCIDGGRAKEVEPRSEDAPGLVALTTGSLRGPSFGTSWEAILDDFMSIPRSSDILDLGIGDLGLSRFPRASLRPAS
jgi:hypothetical protein